MHNARAAANPSLPPLEVQLDAPEVVLRTSASTDTEAEPAALSGNLILRLHERTDIKEIS